MRPSNKREVDGEAGAGLFIVLVIVAVVLVLALAGSALYFGGDQKIVAVPTGICDCPDVLMMINRRNQAQAAINSIRQLAGSQAAKDASQPRPDMYSEAGYEAAKGTNQAAVNNASRGDPTGTGKTGTDCTTDVTDGRTACMRASLQLHENVHSGHCQAFKNKGGSGDWKLGKTMADYWNEDIQGYQAEVAYLDGEINRVKNDPKCKQRITERPSFGDSPEEQRERLHRSRQRVNQYATGIA